MRLKGHQYARGAGFACTGDERFQQRLVTTVHAIEGADGGVH
jgi:hypothetical protein